MVSKSALGSQARMMSIPTWSKSRAQIQDIQNRAGQKAPEHLHETALQVWNFLRSLDLEENNLTISFENPTEVYEFDYSISVEAKQVLVLVDKREVKLFLYYHHRCKISKVYPKSQAGLAMLMDELKVVIDQYF